MWMLQLTCEAHTHKHTHSYTYGKLRWLIDSAWNSIKSQLDNFTRVFLFFFWGGLDETKITTKMWNTWSNALAQGNKLNWYLLIIYWFLLIETTHTHTEREKHTHIETAQSASQMKIPRNSQSDNFKWGLLLTRYEESYRMGGGGGCIRWYKTCLAWGEWEEEEVAEAEKRVRNTRQVNHQQQWQHCQRGGWRRWEGIREHSWGGRCIEAKARRQGAWLLLLSFTMILC